MNTTTFNLKIKQESGQKRHLEDPDYMSWLQLILEAVSLTKKAAK